MTETKKRLAVALSALLLALGCGEEAAEEQELARPVVAVPVVVSTIEERIEATGELDAKERAEVASEVDGVVTELAVDEGERVEEGALLIAVDPEKRALEVANVRAMHRDAQAALAEAERDAARIRKLHGSGIASDAALDKVETGFSRARARVEATKAELGVAARSARCRGARALRRLGRPARRLARRVRPHGPDALRAGGARPDRGGVRAGGARLRPR